MRSFSQQNPDLNLYGAPGTDSPTVAATDGNTPEGSNPADGHTDGDGHAAPVAHTPRPQGARRRGKLVELYESTAVQKLIDDLAARNCTSIIIRRRISRSSNSSKGQGDRTVAHPIFSMPEILERIKEHGRRGVQIKRFKGLGEMNAKELFSTTMDPERRKLLRVNLDDNNAIKADEMFTVLMGDVVEPRRQFIEDNALNVRNLDV